MVAIANNCRLILIRYEHLKYIAIYMKKETGS